MRRSNLRRPVRVATRTGRSSQNRQTLRRIANTRRSTARSGTFSSTREACCFMLSCIRLLLKIARRRRVGFVDLVWHVPISRKTLADGSCQGVGTPQNRNCEEIGSCKRLRGFTAALVVERTSCSPFATPSNFDCKLCLMELLAHFAQPQSAPGQGFRKSHPKRTRFSPPRLTTCSESFV